MYTRGGFSTVEKPPLVNKPKIYKGRLGEVREARGGKSTKPIFVHTYMWLIEKPFLVLPTSHSLTLYTLGTMYKVR